MGMNLWLSSQYEYVATASGARIRRAQRMIIVVVFDSFTLLFCGRCAHVGPVVLAECSGDGMHVPVRGCMHSHLRVILNECRI